MAFASTLPLLFLSRLIAGLFSCNISVGSALVSDITNPKERTKYVGRYNSAYSLGFAIGPLIGGYLAGTDSLNPNYFKSSIFAAAINIINLLILIYFNYNKNSFIGLKFFVDDLEDSTQPHLLF